MVENESGTAFGADEDVRAEVQNLENNFDNIPEDVRNELLLRMSEKADVAGTVAKILERNFDKIPDTARNELLFNLSKYDTFAGEVARIISENFYTLPENIRNLLFQLYKSDKSAGNVVRAVVKNFFKLPENVGILLLVKIYEKYEEISVFYKLPMYVRTKLPEKMRNSIVLEDSFNYKKHPALAEYGPPEGMEELREELPVPEQEKMITEKSFPKPILTKAKPPESSKDEIPPREATMPPDIEPEVAAEMVKKPEVPGSEKERQRRFYEMLKKRAAEQPKGVQYAEPETLVIILF